MKAIELNATVTRYDEKKWQTETLLIVWTEELIESQLNDMLSEIETKSVELTKYFPKSDFTRNEIESILGMYGQIEEDENYYDVTWYKHN